MLISFLFLIISILLCVLSIWYLIRSFIKAFFTKEAPFVPSPQNTAHLLAQHLSIPTGSVVYDLGCGDGRLLRALHTLYPNSTYIGIEHELTPYFLFKFYNRRIIGKNFSISRGNFFKKDISDATHILTYLFPHVMDALLPKLERELQAGTKLISIDFPFTHKKPDQIIELSNVPHTRGKRLYVYEF